MMAPAMTQDADKSAKSLLASMQTAQNIAWAPILFQNARVLRDRGILKALAKANPTGLTIEELAEKTKTSKYGVTVLCEGGMASDLVEKDGDHFRITRAGYLIDRDPMTRANMNFVQDVCYRAAEHLGEAIETGGPSGLKELGPWPTVYDGLRELGEPARTSWLEFDHFYSDDTFPQILPEIFSSEPKRILDVGCNTGKFARQILKYNETVQFTGADLPGQIQSCRENLEKEGLSDRASFHEFSILAADAELPKGADVIWMSQFLSCFSEAEVVHNMSVAKRAMGPDTRFLIMDNLWDRQKNKVAEMCLQATSLYFTFVANGTSRMYDGVTLLKCVKAAGLEVVKETDGIGWGHSIIECRLPR